MAFPVRTSIPKTQADPPILLCLRAARSRGFFEIQRRPSHPRTSACLDPFPETYPDLEFWVSRKVLNKTL